MFIKFFRFFVFLWLSLFIAKGICDNQTSTLSPILPQDTLPFRISIQLEDFSLPNGIHSYVSGIYQNKWLLLAGRTNGLHGFNNDPNNFPPQKQNTMVYVIDPQNQTVFYKSLLDHTSGLSQHQVDILSVTSAQFYQNGNTLYVVGGYGVDTANGQFSTKDTLTAIDIPGLMQWVTTSSEKTASQYIRQISDPLLQVTGGYMDQVSPHLPTLLIFGQNFAGFYSGSSNGNYTQQVRSFRIIDNGKSLYLMPFKQPLPDPNFRRRDLNIVPIIQKSAETYQPALVALSGVFTESGGAWTVPVVINSDGSALMPDPQNPQTFKQGMNNYICPNIGLFSQNGDMYIVLMGGISYEFFQNGVFATDPELPFINQITTIKIDSKGNYQQYLMANQYPLILSTSSNPGIPLLFGAGAQFFSAGNLPIYTNGVFQLNSLGNAPIILGYIVGGIQSTLPNTNTMADSAASSYIFRVILEPL